MSSVACIVNGYGLDGPGFESRWGAKFSATVFTGPGSNPASCTMGTRSFPRVKCGRGVLLTSHILTEQWSRKSRAIPLLPLCAVRTVQSLSTCAVVHLYLFYIIWKGYFGETKLCEVTEASVTSVPETYCWNRGDVQAIPDKSWPL